jgi:2-polyprenyl-3-methyl-5-hydroxy-6-metoxy-1,4-benzoquinol methylase
VADVERNKQLWGTDYDWKDLGEEWSAHYGGSNMQWHGSILPRIQQFLRVKQMLEIAPGYRRWTHWLRTMTDELAIVDLSEICIDACKQRFAEETHISYYVNNGTSLDMVSDESLDFVFSYDSLVHAELDVMQKYIKQLSRKLTPDGVAFIHHSNIGAYESRFEELFPDNPDHGRAYSVTAEEIRKLLESESLHCLSQEIFCCGGELLTDCITVFTRDNSIRHRPCVTLTNSNFGDEAARLKQISELYGRASFTR